MRHGSWLAARRILGPWLLLLGAARVAPAQESCGLCHGELARAEQAGPHLAAGVSCVACHGGVPGAVEVASAHGKALRVARMPRAQVELCGGCHADPERMRGFGLRTDQLLLYRSSPHGKRLEEADDPAVATCVSCHGTHGVLAPSDPRSPVHPRRQPETCGSCHGDAELMARYGLSADPPHLYRDSVHGRALLLEGSLSSPACATCHGSHGATPPRVDEVGRVCGNCHTRVLESFERSPHLAAARDGLLQECVSCHGSHAVVPPSAAMLVGGEAGHCGSCHASSPEIAAVGARLHDALGEFDASLVATEADLAAAERRGVFVEREADLLREARSLRRRASPAVHELSPEALDAVLERGRGMVAETRESLQHEERSLVDRRWLVAVFLGVDLLLAAVLLIHAREVAGRAAGAQGAFGSRGGERG